MFYSTIGQYAGSRYPYIQSVSLKHTVYISYVGTYQ